MRLSSGSLLVGTITDAGGVNRGNFYNSPVVYSGKLTSVNNKRRNGRWISGSHFYMYKNDTVVIPCASEVRTWRGIINYYHKGFHQYRSSLDPYEGSVNVFNSLSGGSDETTRAATLDNLGARAYNALRPDSPDFSVAAELFELKDIPMTIKTLLRQWRRERDFHKFIGAEKAKKAISGKDVAELHLTTQFGILPMVRTVVNFIDAYNGLEKRLQQVVRDAERPIRRHRFLGTDSATYHNSRVVGTAYSGAYITPSWWTGAMPSMYEDITTSIKSETWCEGRFRYILPKLPGTNKPDLARIRRRIMGGRVSLSDIYNVMPWSWLVDYFVDLGQFIEAISPGVADRLINDYFYVMRKTERNARRHSELYYPVVPGNPTSGTTTLLNYTVVKQRRKASLFGYGVNPNSLTPMQLSIMAALGVAKL